MNIFKILFLLVLVLPFAEIYLLLEVGGIIGAFPTIFLVVLTAILGTFLLKQQGFATFRRFQAGLAHGEIPAYELIEGPIILLGGVLLLTPGFISDIIGIACLIPDVRKKIAQYVIESQLIQASGQFWQGKQTEENVLEGEFRKED